MDELVERDAGDIAGSGSELDEDAFFEADRELQAAIEYKIALSGLSGVERILDFVEVAVRRQSLQHPRMR